MSEHPRKLPWGRILAEGVLIVVSILLAFGLQAWWVNVGEQRAEIDALANLRNDFDETARHLTTASERHRLILDSSFRLLAMTGPSPPPSINELLVDSLVMELLGGPTVFPVTGTLDALVGSGRLDLLSNSELRRELAAWSTAMADLSLRELEARAQMVERFLPLIWDFVPVVSLDLTTLSEIYGDTGLTPSRFSRRYEAMLTDRRFENAVEARMDASVVSLNRLTRAEEIVGRILKLVDDELHG